MRDRNPLLLRGEFEEHWIFGASQASLLGVQDVNGRLTGSQAFDNVGVEILIR
jgi:hypothetical protein